MVTLIPRVIYLEGREKTMKRKLQFLKVYTAKAALLYDHLLIKSLENGVYVSKKV